VNTVLRIVAENNYKYGGKIGKMLKNLNACDSGWQLLNGFGICIYLHYINPKEVTVFEWRTSHEIQHTVVIGTIQAKFVMKFYILAVVIGTVQLV